MNRTVSFILFILFLGAMDLYVFQGYKLLVRKWLPAQQLLMNYVYWLIPITLFAILLAMFLNGKNMSNSMFMRFVVSAIFMVYIVKVIWLVFIVIDDIVRLGRFLKGASDIPNEAMMQRINRSEFIVSAGAVVAGSLFGGLVYGVVRGAHNYQVLKRTLKIKGLPKAFEGLRIVQISDVHSGSFWSKDAVKRGIKMINAQEADVIFFTGDIVNNKAEEFEDYIPLFGQLKASKGIYSILGNHDYGDYTSWPDENGLTKTANLDRLKEQQAEMGWNLLLNESRDIEIDGQRLAVIGVENYGAHSGFSQYGDLEKAYATAEGADLKLLLSHDPSHWRAQVLGHKPDIAATFSGHTHGMQFGIDSKYYRWSPVKYRYPEWADLYEEAGQLLYVNRGFGYIGYPGRVGFEPEITVFELAQG